MYALNIELSAKIVGKTSTFLGYDLEHTCKLSTVTVSYGALMQIIHKWWMRESRLYAAIDKTPFARPADKQNIISSCGDANMRAYIVAYPLHSYDFHRLIPDILRGWNMYNIIAMYSSSGFTDGTRTILG